MKKLSFSRLRAVLALVLVAFVGLFVTACSPSGESAESSAASNATEGSWPRTLQTDDGELTLDAKPEKIVSTSTTLTGSLLAVGAPVVASAATVPNVEGLSDDQGFFSQWSQEAKDAGVEKLYENSSPNLEKVAEYSPDLIVVSKNSGDSVMDSVDQLRKIAPVLVIDYSGSSWQDVTTKVAEATGHEEEAQKVIEDFDTRLNEVKDKITVPEGSTSAFIVFGDGSGAAALTEEAPQVQILTSLGFTMAEIPEDVKGDTSMGADRQDIVNLSLENVQKGLTGDNWIAVSADDVAKDQIKNDPAFNTAAAVKDGKVYYTPGETFRLDNYSAHIMLDSLEQSFAQ
ncbi:Fe2+-enterobactin ABC transporter substrate-binding protein [Rothia terrae]|uniref:Fe2+-enterobactin ABC transporter substrate-binding protein n=1 Tax=Rothia terrae TaxID=396015 RepID=A0A7H2BF68_9MICC|nr:Fe2+-enterobactin ABC transporter substrate-binding protein [Rothia terrae]QNV38314.1 Fe2+-enterobactin ABC transporter substrate-binding protein [Rothia terrae]